MATRLGGTEVRYVRFEYCVSLVFATLRRESAPVPVRLTTNLFLRGLPYSLIAGVAGWWGMPWGVLLTLQTIWKNALGGRDITEEMAAILVSNPRPDDRTAGE